MPYIDPEKRKAYDSIVRRFKPFDEMTKGELCYIIYRLMKEWAYVDIDNLRYGNLSGAIAAAEDAAMEFRRKDLDPYEDIMRLKNGPIDPLPN